MNQGEVITLTFGDMAENHVGMEQIGQRASKGEGFHLNDLVNIQIVAEGMGIETEIHKLSSGDLPEAFVLVMRNAVDKLLGEEGFLDQLYTEQKALDWDKQAKIYGRVVNKHARWNLCYDENAREPDYANGKGRIVGFAEVPRLANLREKMAELFGPKAQDLKVEGNYYYDIQKCGIGYHGDGERRKVIAVRLGNVGLPIYYQWYQGGNTVGERIEIDLSPGDIYIIDEKAVGTDWKQKKVPTLRHAAGCAKYC